MSHKLIVKENKKSKLPVRLIPHPKYPIVDIDYDYTDTLPTTNVPVNKLVYREVYKTKLDTFKQEVASMIKAIQGGRKLPPIIVMETGFFRKKFLVIDGHHRAVAFKEMGVEEIPAKIVPKNKVETDHEVPILKENKLKFIKNLSNTGE